jgi:hypothetical protein
MAFSRALARKAFHGNDIYTSAELRASGAQLTNEHVDAINAVGRDYSDFCILIMNELDRWPLLKRYFERLVEHRLGQNAILASGFIAALLQDDNPAEQRLLRLEGNVRNLDYITSGVGLPTDPNAGQETDEVLLDLWNEIFVLDFIQHTQGLKFTDLEKVVRRRDLPQIDLLAQRQGVHYAIEITRVRKKDFEGTTLPNMYDAIYEPRNLNTLRKLLKRKLHEKNLQLQNFCSAESQPIDKRLLVLKTSQREYQDGSTAVHSETNALLSEGAYSSIDEVLLIYDVENYDWIRR